jgi:hypothetical protein
MACAVNLMGKVILYGNSRKLNVTINESFRAVAYDCDSRLLIMIINNLRCMASKRNRFYVAMSNLGARRSNVNIDYVDVF